MAFLKRTTKFDPDQDIVRIAERALVSGTYGNNPANQRDSVLDLFKRAADHLTATLDKFVTINPEMIMLKGLIRTVYSRYEPVLITGPTGTGKELLARAFKKQAHPFVGENCAGIPEPLVESIFFGHKKGSFTGAYEDHIGLLEEAGQGVIFLDEIGDMSLTLQAKFLRAIQECEIRRVGEARTREINCRFVAATKYDLEERVSQQLFREDLYARLMTYPLHVTGLSTRPEDIEPIMRSLLAPGDYELLPPLTPATTEYIYRYNVRALEALVAQWRVTKRYWI